MHFPLVPIDFVMDSVNAMGAPYNVWIKWGSLWYLDVTVRNPDGTQNHTAAFRFNCVAEQDAINAGLNILELDGVSLIQFLDRLETARDNLLQAGTTPAEVITEETLMGHTSSKSELLQIILGDIKAINDRFSTSQLEECTIKLDKTHYYKPTINAF